MIRSTVSTWASASRRPGHLLVVIAAFLSLTFAGAAWPQSAAALPDGTDDTSSVEASNAQVPVGVTAGVAVFDRQTGTFSEQLNASTQFRSASIVKLLLALDFLWTRGPDYTVPAADRTRLNVMLRSSDDDAANHYWSHYGGSAIVNRMTSRLGLTDTAPPPAGQEQMWGYTATSARDTVKVYRYLLEGAPAPVRDLVMGNLRQSTRCASDGFDQHFGVAAAFDRPWAVKQGWSGGATGFEPGTCGPVSSASAPAAVSRPSAPTAATADLRRPALHTTGTVGAGDRSIVAVFSLHPEGTSYGKAFTDLGRLTRSLTVPGASVPSGKWYGTWSSGVNVREEPLIEDGNVLTRLPAGVEVLVGCQKKGQVVSVPPYTNEWWAYLPQYGGYISNIYISHPDNQLPDVPLCPNQQ